MNPDIEEQELAEQIKHQVRKHGPFVLLGVICFFTFQFAWNQWLSYKERKFENASVLFEHALESFTSQRMDEFELRAQELLRHHPKGAYADLSHFLLSSVEVSRKNLDQAESHLNHISKTSKTKAFRQLARIRLGRCLMSENKLDEALSILKTVDDRNQMFLISELQGDIALLQHHPLLARKSYRKALQETPEQEPNALLKLKAHSV